jgi:hypothetical protein
MAPAEKLVHGRHGARHHQAPEESQQILLHERQSALVEVSTLGGLIKICAHRKRVFTNQDGLAQCES